MRLLKVVLVCLIAASFTGLGPDTHASAAAAGTSVYVPMTPQRLVDTRTAQGLAAGSTMDVQVAGQLGVPAYATAVMINVTAVGVSGPGFLQVLPTGRAAIGSASTLNVDVAGTNVPNAAFAPLGEGGRITVYATFSAHVLVDVFGYFAPATSATAGRLVPLTPNRILDTRAGIGWTAPAPVAPVPQPVVPQPPVTQPPVNQPPATPPGNPGNSKNCSDFATYQQAKAWFDLYFPLYGDVALLDADHDGKPCESLAGADYLVEAATYVSAATVVSLQVSGRGGVPSTGASAVVMNVTAVDPASAGYLQVAPTPVSIGQSSNLNTAPGQTVANLVVVPLGANGRVDLYASTSTGMIADVVGYFTNETAPPSSAGLFVPLTPNRQLDTRGTSAAPLDGGTTTRIDVGDVTSAAIAVAGNLTATQAAPGWVQLAAAPVHVGASSNVNISRNGQTIANAVVSPVAGAQLDAYTDAPAHLLLDITGWFTGELSSSPTISMSALAVLDTIPVAPEHVGGYDRALFPHWTTAADGCTTREEVLIRDSSPAANVNASGCTVVSGTWYSPYDATTWSSPADVDIDHVVALSEAWDSGAYAWTTDHRQQFANDLTDRRTLRAVTDGVNASKSDRDPTSWLPPSTADTCRYLGDWISIKARWGLSVDAAERNTVAGVLAGSCAGLTIGPWSATSG